MGSRLAAALSLAAGLLLVVAAQAVNRGVAPPLYDGVVVSEPYRWVNPPSGQPGSPGSFSQGEPAEAGISLAFVAATTETPPQAQLLASKGAFAIPTDTSELLKVELAPLAPPAPASIVGNAYRFSVTDPTGAEVPIAAGAQVTIVLRAPAGTTGASIVRLVNGAWQSVPTVPAGAQDSELATVDTLGVFAIQGSPASNGPSPTTIALAVIVLAGLGGLLVVWLLGRRAAAHSTTASPGKGRSKRRR